MNAASDNVRTAEIHAVLAKSKADYFAGRGGLSGAERSELELELVEIRLRRTQRRDAASKALPALKRSQLVILAEKLAAMGLSHVYEESRREALESMSEPSDK